MAEGATTPLIRDESHPTLTSHKQDGLSGPVAGSVPSVCLGLYTCAPCASSLSGEGGRGESRGLGADSVSADSAGGGQGQGEGERHAWATEARQDPHSFGILAGASGAMK